MTNARLSALLRRATAGRSPIAREHLAVNFSHVLHERSTSDTVHNAVEASQRHSQRTKTANEFILNVPAPFAPNAWIAPSIGISSQISMALESSAFGTAPVILVDQDPEGSTGASFFRAPARLTLPADDTQTVGVAALLVRPHSRSHLLIVQGPFTWPDEKPSALRAVEAMIQAHAEQWSPGCQLWEQPFEVAHPDEVQ